MPWNVAVHWYMSSNVPLVFIIPSVFICIYFPDLSMHTFVFRKSDLETSCFSAMASMRDTRELCDITVKVGNLQIVAHRLVLAAAIPYFRLMFGSKLKEASVKELTMIDVDSDSLSNLINYAYTNSLTITPVNVMPLAQTSHYLGMCYITDVCFSFMWKTVSPETAVGMLLCAEKCCNKEMIMNASCFIRENFDEVSMSDSFVELTLTNMKEIISRDDLNSINEEKVFESVVKWIKGFPEERTSFFSELLHLVRMPLLNSEYLDKFVSRDVFFQWSPLFKDVNKAKKFHNTMPSAVHSISSLERFCKEKHHLKCAKLNGFVVYSVCRTSDLKCSVKYFDEFHEQWHSLCDLSNISACFVACDQECVYFIEYSFLMVLNLKTLERKTLSLELSLPLEAAVILHGKQVFIFGGSECISAGPTQANISLKNSILCLETDSGQCEKVAQMQNYRALAACASLDDMIYITGGITDDPSLYNSAEVYDPSTRTSREISPMINRRFSHMCASLEGKIYACGGQTIDSSGAYRMTSTCEFYHPRTGQWTSVKDMKFGKIPKSFISFRNQLYAAGVIEDLDPERFESEMYDVIKNDWTSQHPLIHPSGNTSPGVLLSNSFTIL